MIYKLILSLAFAFIAGGLYSISQQDISSDKLEVVETAKQIISGTYIPATPTNVNAITQNTNGSLITIGTGIASTDNSFYCLNATHGLNHE